MKRNLFLMVLMTICPYLFSQEWTTTIDIGRSWTFWDEISVDNGEAVLGIGYTSNENGFLVKIDKDGEYIDRVVHIPGFILRYYSAVQLDNGNYMAFGVCDDSLCDPDFQKHICVDIFDRELEPVGSRVYDVEDDTFECFSNAHRGALLNAVLSSSGTVILAAAPSYYVGATRTGYYYRALLLYELDQEGNILAKKPHASARVSSIREINYEPHSDNLRIALTGGSFSIGTGSPGFYLIDTDLEIVGRQHLNNVQGGWGFEVDYIEDITTDGNWIDGKYMILHAWKSELNHRTFTYSSLYKLDSALNVYGELRLPPYDSCTWIPSGTSTAYINDSTVFAFTYCAESMYSSDTQQANVLLVDKCLNLLGRKTIRQEYVLARAGVAATFNDEGCVVPITTRSSIYYQGEPFYHLDLMKFRREDIEITWDVVQESGTRERLLPYPNPTGGYINIPLPEAVADNARILLFDARGVKCLDSAVGQEGNLIRLDTGNLAQGLYVYRIVAGSRTVAEGKLVKD